MDILLALITSRRPNPSSPPGELLESFVQRASRYCPCSSRTFATEEKLLGALNVSSGRTRPVFLLADSRGDQVTSEDMAAELNSRLDGGTQLLVIGIGPADGWSPVALQRADRRIAFGRITLPHELAAVIAAEQIYRGLTIRAGHPYHSGH